MVSVFDLGSPKAFSQATASKEVRSMCKRAENVLFVGIFVNRKLVFYDKYAKH
jgi:hypothetical protein